jgi:hypothetical protein
MKTLCCLWVDDGRDICRNTFVITVWECYVSYVMTSYSLSVTFMDKLLRISTERFHCHLQKANNAIKNTLNLPNVLLSFGPQSL